MYKFDTAPWRNRADLFAIFAVALYFLWAGLMKFYGFEQQSVGSWIGKHRWLGDLSDSARLSASVALGVSEIVIALLLVGGLKRAALGRIGAVLALILSLLSLSLMFTNPVWIESMGGFPVIGAGQGVIKYLTFAGVALYLFGHFGSQDQQVQQRALLVILAGLILVLGWIGVMKFTLIEAKGIADLLETSPLLMWLPMLFEVQGASNVIGVLELVTVAGLLLWLRGNGLLFQLTALLAMATFLTTLSFMLSSPGWHKDMGFPFIGGGGQFLLRDLVLLAGTLLLLVNPRRN